MPPVDPLAFLTDIFTGTSGLITAWLESLGAPEWVPGVVLNFIGAFVVANALMVTSLFIIWMERKVVSRMQDRIGPNRLGPWGLFQNIADAAKLLTKELIIPRGADLIPFLIAPVLSVLSVLMIWAAIPVARTGIGSDVSIGVLYIVAVSSLGVMAVLMAGWSSNNKYALLGAFRAVAMLVSYEIPVIITLMIPVLLSGSMRVGDIVEAQPIWFIFSMPVAALIFFIAMTAEISRAPFDFTEAESEIVAGFHTEYSGMAFATFYLAEFLHAFTLGAMMTTLFLGGWRLAGAEVIPTLGIIFFLTKTFAVYFVNQWIRYTIPRLRIDQAMSFCWKFLTPISLLLLVLTVFVDKIAALYIPNYLATDNVLVMLPRTVVLLGVNVIVALVAFGIIARQGRLERQHMDTLQYAPVEPLAPIETGADE